MLFPSEEREPRRFLRESVSENEKSQNTRSRAQKLLRRLSPQGRPPSRRVCAMSPTRGQGCDERGLAKGLRTCDLRAPGFRIDICFSAFAPLPSLPPGRTCGFARSQMGTSRPQAAMRVGASSIATTRAFGKCARAPNSSASWRSPMRCLRSARKCVST
jgi:hypothetical protein